LNDNEKPRPLRRGFLREPHFPVHHGDDLLFLSARKKKEQKERCIGF